MLLNTRKFSSKLPKISVEKPVIKTLNDISYYVIDGASLTLTCFTRGDEDDDGDYVWEKDREIM